MALGVNFLYIKGYSFLTYYKKSSVNCQVYWLIGFVQSSVVAHFANLTGLGVTLGVDFVTLGVLRLSGIRAVIS